MTQGGGEQRDLRETLPELLAMVRNSRCKPWAFVHALALGVKRGLELTRNLPALRRSYLLSLTAVGAALAVEWGFLCALSPGTHLLLPALVTLVWFLGGSIIVASQLALVRRRDGRLFARFGLANTFTLYRFMNIPLLVALLPLFPDHRPVLVIGSVIFALAAASDAADGNYARVTNTVSEFGRIYDPVCDIALNAGVCLGAWFAGYLPGLYVLLAELRFFLPLLGGAWIYAHRKPWRIRPTIWGKISVFVYALFIALLLVKELSQAPFLQDLTLRFMWLSGLLFAFNIMLIVDRGLTMARDQAPTKETLP